MTQEIAISTMELEKTYGGVAPVRALAGVSLSVPRGQFLAITGPSGSGKSTLLNLIGTLDRPTSGEVVIEGIEVGDLKGDDLADFRRQNIGFVFQMFHLVPVLTSLENVMLPLVPYRRRLSFDLRARSVKLLKAVGLGERLKHLPGQLSGGEQQRVAIARALVNHPKIVLADEPTGNIDSKAGEEIIAMLRSLNQEQGLTVVMVTHDLSLAKQADQSHRLQDGKLL